MRICSLQIPRSRSNYRRAKRIETLLLPVMDPSDEFVCNKSMFLLYLPSVCTLRDVLKWYSLFMDYYTLFIGTILSVHISLTLIIKIVACSSWCKGCAIADITLPEQHIAAKHGASLWKHDAPSTFPSPLLVSTVSEVTGQGARLYEGNGYALTSLSDDSPQKVPTKSIWRCCNGSVEVRKVSMAESKTPSSSCRRLSKKDT